MLERAQDCVKKYIPLLDTPLVVAVSGGVDSMLLVSLLLHAGYSHIHIAHVHHGLREEAAQDLSFVKSFAADHGIQLHVRHVDIAQEAKQAKDNIENTGRKARYVFLEEVRQKTNAEWILLGHHLDDLAESQLLHTQRGSGLFGLVGFEEADARRHVLRPLRSYNKQELLSVAKDMQLAWREDISNQNITFRRNELRHITIPKLKERFPTFLADMLDISNNASAILSQLYTKIEYYLGKDFEKKRSWPLASWVACSEEERSYALLWLLRSWRPGSNYTEKTILPRAKELVLIQSGKVIQLTKDFALRRSFYHIDILDTSQEKLQSRKVDKLPAKLPIDGFTIHFIKGEDPISNIVAPISLLKDGFTIRGRKSGDTLAFSHEGTIFHKSVKKFLVEKKIPVDKRDNLPMLVSNKSQEIVAILSQDTYYRHPEVSTADNIVTIHIT